jgi:hypothetical protein
MGIDIGPIIKKSRSLYMTVLTNKSKELKHSLAFLNVKELKTIALKLFISEKGKKGQIIARIIYFAKTGEKQKLPQIPKKSYAVRGVDYPLNPNSLILKGAYKNDLKTRLFFKKLIGDYFHFTAFGVDWIDEQWMDGNPPTYQEFADMWRSEYKRRQETPANPKEEWAYINFVQQYLNINPTTTRDSLTNAWKIERQKNKEIVSKILAITF